MKILLQHWVRERAERCPDDTALVMQEERHTYAQLEEASNRLARQLKSVGCRKGDRVCLLMPKSPAAIVGILGILKADCIYVPLDVASPAPRLAQMLAACEPRCLLAAGPVGPLLDDLWSTHRLYTTASIGWMEAETGTGQHFKVEFSEHDLQGCASQPTDSVNDRRDAAYILFTSGSTGTPKGVVITHDNVMHFVEWAIQYFGIDASERLSGHPPLHFDLSTFDIFGTFAAGAQLHLVPPESNLLPHKLADFIRTAELTQWFSVPSVLNYMAKFDVVRGNDFPSLKRLLWCGEVLPTPVLIYWMQRLPKVRFTNLYGPTEATIASSYYTVPACPDDKTAAIPIGAPCAGEELLVLDEALRAVRPGDVGDLYIRGAGLSPGYWREPEKTQAAFLPYAHATDPSDLVYKTGDLAKIGDDGLVYFLGRADSQIKSRGYRIELGEIETALNALPHLQECAVVTIDTEAFQGATICGAYVPVATANLSPATLRKELSEVLPSYMLPARWLALESLPKNVNGKIDRPRLKERFQAHETEPHRDIDN